ncbi:MAG TPA: nucleotidyltransferase domain-containing protein [Acidisphaera sp.]|nr:nucleotidyltransferase domain-containing protein [Acidisphaera sp.]
MTQDDILTRLRANEASLKARGVIHAALFGSRARGQGRPDSDTDILVELEPRVTIYDLVAVQSYIAGLLDGRVDVIDADALKPAMRPAVAADALYAF